MLASLQDVDNTVEDEISKAKDLNNISWDKTLLDDLAAQTLQNDVNDISPFMDHITITTAKVEDILKPELSTSVCDFFD